MPSDAPPPNPDAVARAVDRALARAFPDGADAWDVPRDLAVSLAVSEGISAEQALARLGIAVTPGASVPEIAFVLVPYGNAFWLDGVRYRKVQAKWARDLFVGAPNATPIDGGDGLFVAPATRVRPVRERRRPLDG